MAIEEVLGVLPDDWELMTLGEACQRGGGDIQTGPFGSQLHASDYVACGIPSIMPKNIGDNRVSENDIARIKPNDAKRLGRYLVRKGDIVYSRRGDVERRALIREHENGWLCGTGCLRVRLGTGGVNPAYASHYLGHPSVREWVVRHAHGATMLNLNTSILSALPFVVPPATEQNAIAHILSTFDDKIELNRRMNGTFDQMARALFKSWFVDFEPVRAKAEGRDTGLPGDIAELFPEEFADSELGDVPAGWMVQSLDQVAQFLNGLALQKYPPTGERSLPVIKIAQLRAGNTVNADSASADIEQEYVVQDGDILFSWSGSLECGLWAGGPGALNQHLFKVIPLDYPKWLCYLGVHQHIREFRHIAAGKATTMGHIQRHHLSDAKLAIPSPELLRRMDDVIRPMVENIWNRAVQSRTLASLRDTLLPKLLSGEIRVESAEKAVAEAL